MVELGRREVESGLRAALQAATASAGVLPYRAGGTGLNDAVHRRHLEVVGHRRREAFEQAVGLHSRHKGVGSADPLKVVHVAPAGR
jgi:hypothetical protein